MSASAEGSRRLVLRRGRVLDPGAGVDRLGDLLVGAPDAVPGAGPADHEVDAGGLLVLPGLVDMHAHVFAGGSHYGVAIDENCVDRGVTTVVDAGSAGAANVGRLKDVASPAVTRVRSLLNVARQGMREAGPGEMARRGDLDVAAAVDAIEQNRGLVVGVKARLGELTTDDPHHAVTTAKAIGRETGLPVMLHITSTIMPLDMVLDLLDEGDIVTHVFHSRTGRILDDAGEVLPSVWAARERGVVFDLGHGSGSFDFEVAELALGQGFLPDVVSSDLHAYNAEGPVVDLVTTMSKLLHLGMPLDDVVRACTATPARVLGIAEAGSLGSGSGDVTAIEVVEEDWQMFDSMGNVRTAHTRLVPRWVVRDGLLRPTRPHRGGVTPSSPRR